MVGPPQTRGIISSQGLINFMTCDLYTAQLGKVSFLYLATIHIILLKYLHKKFI